jgi:Serine/Threonine/Tyrosine Kinase found in polyvalent proteins
MDFKNIKYELKNILQGKSTVSNGELIQTTANYLRECHKASGMAEENKPDRQEETKTLIKFINENKLWNCNINFAAFVSQGAEQRVYIQNDKKVLKLNDAIYYRNWLDYFNNLLLNNYFFPDTAYQLLGFYKTENDIIYALVTQNYVEANQHTDLAEVKQYLENNGFENTKNHDYYHSELGIILEDLHDENVLTKDNLLYFIDTVFYIKNHPY